MQLVHTPAMLPYSGIFTFSVERRQALIAITMICSGYEYPTILRYCTPISCMDFLSVYRCMTADGNTAVSTVKMTATDIMNMIVMPDDFRMPSSSCAPQNCDMNSIPPPTKPQ